MKPVSFSGLLCNIPYLLLYWQQPSTVQAISVNGPSVERRYYHHEVNLDESKHHDEFFTFVTRPDLDAPKWDIQVLNKDAVSPGYWFAAPYANALHGQPDAPWVAPHIYDSNGDLIWSGAPVFAGFPTFDFRVTNVQGRPMLSVIYSHDGSAVIFDETYNIHKVVELGDKVLRENESGMNMHEFTTVNDGTKALHLYRVPRRASRESSKSVDFDGECYAIFDGIRELDTQTWNVTNEWNSEGRVGLDESYVTQEAVSERCDSKKPWDFFHANSIDTFPNGDYLVSGRRTYAIYRISRATGSIVWRLGGRNSDFKMPFKFAGQHDAKIYESNDTHTLLTFLDNAHGPGTPQTTNNQSRGLLIQLDTTAMTAMVVAEYPHPEKSFATSRGNMQMLPSGNVWLCWVSSSLQTEYTFDGSLLLKAQFKAKVSSYRTFKHPWIGRPSYPPDVHAAVIDKNGQWYTVVHMSWNGATEVREWEVYHTNENGTENKMVTKVQRQGFETSAWTEGFGTRVFVQAVDQDGNTLGRSAIFASLPPRNRSQSGLEFGSHSDELTGLDAAIGLTEESWLKSIVRRPRTTFVFGILLGVFASVLTWTHRKWFGLIVKACGTARRMRKTQPYEPLNKEDEEQMELGGYDDEEDRLSEFKSIGSP